MIRALVLTGLAIGLVASAPAATPRETAWARVQEILETSARKHDFRVEARFHPQKNTLTIVQHLPLSEDRSSVRTQEVRVADLDPARIEPPGRPTDPPAVKIRTRQGKQAVRSLLEIEADGRREERNDTRTTLLVFPCGREDAPGLAEALRLFLEIP
jgi:hypothetical protein